MNRMAKFLAGFFARREADLQKLTDRWFPWEFYVSVQVENGLVFAVTHGDDATLSGDPELEVRRLADLVALDAKVGLDGDELEYTDEFYDMTLPLDRLVLKAH